MLIAIGVNLRAPPILGWTLPLMGDSGTGLVVFCLAIALLLRAEVQTRHAIAAAPALLGAASA